LSVAGPTHKEKGTDLKSVPFSVESRANPPELSVIIPTLNEVEALPCLLADLANQTGVDFEVLVSDGGSTDATRDSAAAMLARYRMAGKVLTGETGRGRQLNRGASLARGPWLLFLHADSRLPDPLALAKGLSLLRSEENLRRAGHFSLRFDLPDDERHFEYFFCEVKARCGFSGTIHGDQGFLLSRTFFAELDGFREDLPVLEDTLLAEKVRSQGGWHLLPVSIVTSPRRFMAEGFLERQTLNALLMNFAIIGWDKPLRRIPEVYRPQSLARTLVLAPFFGVIDDYLAELPMRERARIWYHMGRFVRGNAWQPVLRRAARRAFAAGTAPGAVALEPVRRFCRWFDLLTDHPAGHLAAALLTWIWFRTRRRESVQGG